MSAIGAFSRACHRQREIYYLPDYSSAQPKALVQDNPYSPPAAPVDSAPESPVPRSLRTLLRALIILEILALPLVIGLPERLPPELQAIRDKYDMAFVAAYPAITLISLVVSYVSLFG